MEAGRQTPAGGAGIRGRPCQPARRPVRRLVRHKLGDGGSFSEGGSTPSTQSTPSTRSTRSANTPARYPHRPDSQYAFSLCPQARSNPVKPGQTIF